MSVKKGGTGRDAGGLRPLEVGSRVRCTDDGVEGRIVWANATSVKVRWDDGEQVTWRRDGLAGRPVEILEPDDGGPAQDPVQAPAPDQATDSTPAEPASAPPEA